MHILRSIEELRLLRAQTIAGLRTIGFVPTMGALHLGHAKLFKVSTEKSDVTIASIFINPQQFNSAADLAKYPRTIDEDIATCQTFNVDFVYLPEISDIYPDGFDTFIAPGSLSSLFEGSSRPGHFAGMATVVVKLFNIVQPNFAFFGKKDYQQLAIIRRLVADLNFPIQIFGMETVREDDGLALSSRNAQLTDEERDEAPRFFEILNTFNRPFPHINSLNEAFSDALRQFGELQHFRLDYFEIAEQDSLQPSRDTTKSLVALGAILGSQVRLIDNQELQ